jgi:hypothetical protein
MNLSLFFAATMLKALGPQKPPTTDPIHSGSMTVKSGIPFMRAHNMKLSRQMGASAKSVAPIAPFSSRSLKTKILRVTYAILRKRLSRVFITIWKHIHCINGMIPSRYVTIKFYVRSK